jgi:pimeloyl-ACP methyl ester carboxylesterase
VTQTGQVIPDYASVEEDEDLLVRVTTKDMRGKIGSVHLYEDDAPFEDDYIGPIRFVVPLDRDTVLLRYNSHWTNDGFGLFGDPEYRVWASTDALESISSQRLSVVERQDPNDDPNDTLSDAIDLGELVAERVGTGSISAARDVDVYQFKVKAGQWVAFDVDIADAALLDSYLRVFDATGKLLASNDNGNTNTDPMARAAYERDRELPAAGLLDESPFRESAFTHHLFTKDGTYFVAVSGKGNSRFDPRTGTGDADGDRGRYNLTVTPLTRITSDRSSSGLIEGEVRLPNPEPKDWRNTVVKVKLQRFVDQGTAIASNLFTWLLIHGRENRAADWGEMPRLVSRHVSAVRDQVLTLDWEDGSKDNDTYGGLPVGLEGSAWIPMVGQWAQTALKNEGIAATNLGLIGHSWGTYVGYELARRFGGSGVRAFVALDPAFGGAGSKSIGLQYDADRVNFAAVSGNSWAFYGNGQFGSARLSGTADEAFAIAYGTIPTNWLAAHDAPRALLRHLLSVNNAQRAQAPEHYRWFLLDLLLVRPGRRPWRANQLAAGSTLEPRAQVFEGEFVVNGSSSSGQFRLTGINRFRYVKA